MNKMKGLRILIALVLSVAIFIFIKNPINWLLGAIGMCALSIFTDRYIPSLRVGENIKRDNTNTVIFMFVLLVLYFAFR